MTQKILAQAAGLTQVQAGQLRGTAGSGAGQRYHQSGGNQGNG